MFSAQCDKGAPTCLTNLGKCDVCNDPFPMASQYGCTNCFTDNDCAKFKRAGTNEWPKFCFPKLGHCGGECGEGGMAACAGLYNGTKPVCIDNAGDGGWCHACSSSNLHKPDKYYCDKEGTSVSHSKTPFCMKDLTCGSCEDVFKASGKCPNNELHNYGQVCVQYKKSCFALKDAPCSAFTDWGIAGCLRHRKGGDKCTWNSKKKTCNKA